MSTPSRQLTERPAVFWVHLSAPVLLMALIFWLGDDRASAAHSRSLIERLLEQAWPSLYRGLSAETLQTMNVLVRKGGHFFGYALLGLLNAQALRALRGSITARDALLPWGLAAAWAAVDEFHQSFSPSRGAALEDVALDAAGAAAGIIFYLLWKRHTTRKS